MDIRDPAADSAIRVLEWFQSCFKGLCNRLQAGEHGSVGSLLDPFGRAHSKFIRRWSLSCQVVKDRRAPYEAFEGAQEQEVLSGVASQAAVIFKAVDLK